MVNSSVSGYKKTTTTTTREDGETSVSTSINYSAILVLKSSQDRVASTVEIYSTSSRSLWQEFFDDVSSELHRRQMLIIPMMKIHSSSQSPLESFSFFTISDSSHPSSTMKKLEMDVSLFNQGGPLFRVASTNRALDGNEGSKESFAAAALMPMSSVDNGEEEKKEQ